MSTAGLILAAGEGSRFGGPKAPFVFEGERLIDRSVRLMRAAGIDNIVVVLGAWSGDVPHAQVVVNENWHTGMGSSLKIGLTHFADQADVDRIVVTLVDLVGLTGEAIHRVTHSLAPISIATYNGTRGHPVTFARPIWTEVSNSVSGDVGAREYIRNHDDLIQEIEVGDVATGEDMDIRPN